MCRRAAPCKLLGMSTAFLVFLVCWIVGLIGNFFPLMPAILVVFGGVVAATFLKGFEPGRDIPFLVLMGIITIFITLVDNFASAWGARKYGGSKWGMWGAVIGGVLGMFFPLGPLVGLIVGPLAGALIAELLQRRPFEEALRSAWGTLVGLATGMAAKFVLIFLLGLYELWRLWEPARAAVGA